MKTIRCGETFILEEPYCHALIQKLRSIYCDYCFAKCDALQRCSGCSSTWYCNTACQKRDWVVYKKECKCLKNYLPKVPLEFVRLLLRLLITESLDLPKDPSCPRTFEDLKTHTEEIKNDIERSEHFANILYCLKETTGNVVRLPSTSVVFDTFCRLMINSYSIFDWQLMDLGIGVYLRGSMYNHSCKPNALTMFDGIKLVFRAIEHIQDPSVETVFINYFELPFVPREMLMKEYYFECRCERCLNETLMDPVHGFCCVNPMCESAVGLREDNSFKSCTKCHLKDFPVAYQERALKILQDCKSQLNQVNELNDYSGWLTLSCRPAEISETRLAASKVILNKCQLILEDVKMVLHPMNVFRLSVVDRTMDAAIDTEQWQLALNFALSTLAPYGFYYSRYIPNYAVVLFKIGKLQVMLEYYKDALAHLQQASKILPITHGGDHEILKETRLLISRCKNALGIQRELS